jgi:cytochrome P450
MSQTTTTSSSRTTPSLRDHFARVLAPASRPDPYPLYAELRRAPVSLQSDGTYVVSTHAEIARLLHDPRVSSDERKSARRAGALASSGRLTKGPPFIFLDPPDHDRLRRIIVRQFTPERVNGKRARVATLVDELLDARRERGHLDVVDDLAYPLPVTVICELLGVPREDEPKFQGWSTALARSLDPIQGLGEDEIQSAVDAQIRVQQYMKGLAADRRARPRDDMISGLVADPDTTWRGNEDELLVMLTLLLVAGHETTVNLITNGTLTLLRHRDALERLRREPELVVTLVEEVLRYDPPVQFRTRTVLADVELGGVTIPKGATVALLLASGSRDERRFPRADRFDPARTDNAHFGFGGGAHYCVGAPLARLEAQVALGALARRLVAPRLAQDPPPYRENAALRGPRHLPVTFERLVE